MNKKIFQIMCGLFLAVLFFSTKDNRLLAMANLDEIEEYTIRVEPDFQDGSLEMTYDVVWRVLDSDTEGPLTWVKIGIPNVYAADLEKTTDTVEKIKFLKGSGESYVRVDLDRAYYAGETLHFGFRFRQHRMYQLQNESRRYQFTPGWFDEIRVNKLTILWKEDHVATAMGEWQLEDGFYRYEKSLSEGQRFPVTLIYPDSCFEEQDNKSEPLSGADWILVVIMVGLPLGACGYMLHKKGAILKTGDRYDSQSGMGDVYYRSSFEKRSGKGGGGGGGCACACACACAGGGRAGCAQKEFYGAKMIRQAKGNEKDADRNGI